MTEHPLPPVPSEPGQPTQVAHPGQAVKRTALQAFLADLIGWVLFLGAVAPAAAAIVGEELEGVLPDAWLAWLVLAAGVVASVAAVITRIMALPRVNALLERIRLGARPGTTR